MKRNFWTIIFILVILMGVYLTSCTSASDESKHHSPQTEQIPTPKQDEKIINGISPHGVNIFKVEYCGHWYIIFRTSVFSSGDYDAPIEVIHDPDCQCHREDKHPNSDIE